MSEKHSEDSDSGFGEVQEQQRYPNINDLPDEILIHIFLKVDSYSRRRAELVCTRWNDILVNSPELLKFVKIDRSLLPEQQLFSHNFKGIVIQLLYFEPYLGIGRKHQAECIFLTDESNADKRGYLDGREANRVSDHFFVAVNQLFTEGLLQKPVRVIFHRVALSFLAFRKPKDFPMDNIASIKFVDACLCNIVYQGFEYGPTPTRKVAVDHAEVDLRMSKDQVLMSLWDIIQTKSEPLNAEEKNNLLDLICKVQNNPDNVYRFRKIIAGIPWEPLKPLPKPQKPIDESSIKDLSVSVQRELLNAAHIFVAEERFTQWWINVRRGGKNSICRLKNRGSRK